MFLSTSGSEEVKYKLTWIQPTFFCFQHLVRDLAVGTFLDEGEYAGHARTKQHFQNSASV